MSADSQDQEASVSGQKRNKANSLRGRILSKVVKKRWTPVQRWSARISSLIHLEERAVCQTRKCGVQLLAGRKFPLYGLTLGSLGRTEMALGYFSVVNEVPRARRHCV